MDAWIDVDATLPFISGWKEMVRITVSNEPSDRGRNCCIADLCYIQMYSLSHEYRRLIDVFVMAHGRSPL